MVSCCGLGGCCLGADCCLVVCGASTFCGFEFSETFRLWFWLRGRFGWHINLGVWLRWFDAYGWCCDLVFGLCLSCGVVRLLLLVWCVVSCLLYGLSGLVVLLLVCLRDLCWFADNIVFVCCSCLM